MARGGKYIIYKEHSVDDDNEITPIIFPKAIGHDVMVMMLKKTFKDLIVISAGFVSIENNNLITYGDSFSLKIGSRPEDKTLINIHLMETIVI